MDVFKELVVPVVGGLGLFMLGLEFMSDGIHNLAVNRMRALLAKIAGTPAKGVLAGTLITGVLQSSTAMTVMVVGLVNSGVLSLRSAISVIMGANIGTTLGNGLIALPLGPIGLLLSGLFALVYVFSKSERVKNIAFACMGFSLIFYGLNLMTGGLRPLRDIPDVMAAISSLSADSFGGLVSCVLIAAAITALIHSSSATIGIVMGLGAAGILSWQTAVAFSLGADLGTTITSWMASLNLSKNAKRAAYAHISFNVIGVLVMLPLFFPSMKLLTWVMGFFGGDPAVPVIQDGKEVFPLIPVAVGIYSTSFNIFNTLLLFPFVGTFERVLSKVGHTSEEDREDYSVPRHLDLAAAAEFSTGVGCVHQELARQVEAAALFVGIARRAPGMPKLKDHNAAIEILGRDIRRYTAALFQHAKSPGQSELLASLIEEADLTATLGDTLHQVARHVLPQALSAEAQALVDATLARIGDVVTGLSTPAPLPDPLKLEHQEAFLLRTREKCLASTLSWEERGVVLELLGSAKRAFYLVDLVRSERASVTRST
jgi:phosphate:Na+ symporter